MSGNQDSISDLAAHCIRCGFCLESCPTFVVTGKETESPRGRIYLIRSADAGTMDWSEGVREHLDACVGCRACETACPSGVEYGVLLELARDRLEKIKPSSGKALLLKGVTSPSLLRVQLLLGRLLPGKKMPRFVSRLITKEAPTAEKPSVQGPSGWPPLDERAMPPIKGEVLLLEGCAMQVLFPRVHEATRRLLRRVGFSVRPVTGCCGALHAHNGFLDKAISMAKGIEAQVQAGSALVVNSAGCGSFLKEQAGPRHKIQDTSHPLPIQDISEFLFDKGLAKLLGTSKPLNQTVTYHDACHLAHGQNIRAQPRKLIESMPGLVLNELAEADMCCGSGGIYNLTQPVLARQLLERKWANILATEAEIVASGNPGCHAWIEQRSRESGGSIKVLHTAELLEAAFSGLPHPVE